MTVVLLCLALILCLAGSGLFSGGETGLYSLSHARVEAEARDGDRTARLVRRLLQDDAGLLATILVGNNLANLLATGSARGLLLGFDIPPSAFELVLTVLLAPFLFFFSELLPKDLFRRRPHVLVGYVAPWIATAKGLFLPLALPLRWLAEGLQRALGLKRHALARAHGAEAVMELIRETSPTPHLEDLSRNVLRLRTLLVEEVMIPWRRVETVRAGDSPAELERALGASRFSRLPRLDRLGRVDGYLLQLDWLGAPSAEAGPGAPSDCVREVLFLAPTTPVDRALVELRGAGQRAAVVGTAERPLGWVTLKDLLEEICGELVRW